MSEPTKAVVLLSGGLDSATTLAIAQSEQRACLALTFAYGQRCGLEIEAARRIAASAGVSEHRMIELDALSLGGFPCWVTELSGGTIENRGTISAYCLGNPGTIDNPVANQAPGIVECLAGSLFLTGPLVTNGGLIRAGEGTQPGEIVFDTPVFSQVGTLQAEEDSKLIFNYPLTNEGRIEILNGGRCDGELVTNVVGGEISGEGTVLNDLVNEGTIRPGLNRTLSLNGQSIQNEPTGLIQVPAAAILTVDSPGFSNAGTLDIRSVGVAIFENQANPLVNQGNVDLLGGMLVTVSRSFMNAVAGNVYGFGDIDTNVSNEGAVTIVADTQIIGDLENNGTVTVQNGTLTVIGSVSGSGTFLGDVWPPPGTPRCTEDDLGDAPGRSAAPALFVTGDLRLGPNAAISLGDEGPRVGLAGDFDVAIDDDARFEMSAATLQMVGLPQDGPQTLEVLAEDVGANVTLPLERSHFPIGLLYIGPTAAGVHLVDEHRNSASACDEALYVDTLVLDADTTFVLNGHNVYYGALYQDPGAVVDRLGGALIQIGLPCLCGDLDGSGEVNLADFVTFAQLFGQPATGSPPDCGG